MSPTKKMCRNGRRLPAAAVNLKGTILHSNAMENNQEFGNSTMPSFQDSTSRTPSKESSGRILVRRSATWRSESSFWRCSRFPYLKPSRNCQYPNEAVTVRAGERSWRFVKGEIFYLHDEKVVGVMLWNMRNRIGTAWTSAAQHMWYDHEPQHARSKGTGREVSEGEKLTYLSRVKF